MYDLVRGNDAAGSTQMQYPLAARSGEALGVRGGEKVILELAIFLVLNRNRCYNVRQ